MMQRSWLFKFLVAIITVAKLASAQSTTVSATVVDQLGVTWTNATGLVSFVPTPGISGPYTWDGGPYNQGPIPFSTNGAGFFSISLPANCNIVPSGSAWNFSIAPNQSSQAVSITLNICGATQDIGTDITNATNTQKVQSWPIPRGYSDTSMATPPNMGQMYFDTTNLSPKFWSGSTWITFPTSEAFLNKSPSGSQTVVQPVNTDLTFSTSGTGRIILNGTVQSNGSYTHTGPFIINSGNNNTSVNTTGGGKFYYNTFEVLTTNNGMFKNGVTNVALYCTTAGVLDQTCLENAAIATPNATLFVPAGNYSGTTSNINQSNLHIQLDPSAKLNYTLSINGSGFTTSNSVNVATNPTAGTSVIPGNFSAFAVGQTVVVEQIVNNGQVPVDFATVAAANGTSLTLSTPLRFSYTTPKISIVSNIVKFPSSLSRGTTIVTGNYTSSFSAGDVIRIENITGTDSPPAGTAYFEYARIASINSSQITLETGLHSTFGAPWIAKVNVVNDISFTGGFIYILSVNNATKVNINNTSCTTSIIQYIYDGQFDNIHAATNLPSAYYFTFMWNSSFTNINAYGGTATTDNGNIKYLGIQGTAASGLTTWQGTNTVEGEYPLMYDYNYTPYSMWNANNTLSSASVGTTNGVTGASIFIGGMRDSTLSSITTPGNVTLLFNSRLGISNLSTNGIITLQSGDAYRIDNFYSDSMAIGTISAVSNSTFSNFRILGGATENGSSAINILGGSNNRFLHGEFVQSNLTFFTVNAQAGSNNNYYEDLQDYSGTNLLFSLHTNGTGSHSLVGNRFAAAVQGPFNTTSFQAVSIAGAPVPTTGAPTVGKAACIKAAGPPVLIGFCSTVVDAAGACTCN